MFALFPFTETIICCVYPTNFITSQYAFISSNHIALLDTLAKKKKGGGGQKNIVEPTLEPKAQGSG